MNSSHHIIITGFMGSGKTTVARALAEILGRQLLDLDQVIAEQEGRTAREIIEQDGEPSFREKETRRLREVLQNSLPGVVALGGGAWTLERNRQLIDESCGITVWLDAPFDLCWERILNSGVERPLARDENQARILYAERRPLYALAQLHVLIEDKATGNIAAEIAQALKTESPRRQDAKTPREPRGKERKVT
jgi:shikimate kinase